MRKVTKWNCLLCGMPIAREHLVPVTGRTRKWIAAYHRICRDIEVADMVAHYDAYERELQRERRRPVRQQQPAPAR